MWWRILAVTVVLLAVGVVGGYAVSQATDSGPESLGPPAPVDAGSPSVPTAPSITVLPDPTDAPLGVDLPTETEHLQTAKKNGNELTVAIPKGWKATRVSPTRWTFTLPDAPYNTYVLRIDIVAGQHQSVGVVEASRLDAYRDAEKNGALEDFSVQQSGDTFVATYVQNGYLRVTEERVLDLGEPSAYVDVAVTGRQTDRAGLMDLLARTAGSMVAG